MTLVLSRRQWGARTDLGRRGHKISPVRRTKVFIHHTVMVDDDDSPNEWESLEQVRRCMRRLQTTRPDLGFDVPYSMVAFCMSDATLVLAEGRGLERTGAHTAGHNRSALGIAFQGNFERGPLPRGLDDRLAELGTWLTHLRRHRGFVNLGQVRPAGRDVWAHRDVKATLCPGGELFKRLDRIRFVDEEDETMMDRPTWKKVQQSLQALDPPLYGGRRIDGMPGRNTHLALRAFERRVELEPRGVLNDPGGSSAASPSTARIWPATRELLFAMTAT